jgi:hypothetical protein
LLQVGVRWAEDPSECQWDPVHFAFLLVLKRLLLVLVLLLFEKRAGCSVLLGWWGEEREWEVGSGAGKRETSLGYDPSSWCWKGVKYLDDAK